MFKCLCVNVCEWRVQLATIKPPIGLLFLRVIVLQCRAWLCFNVMGEFVQGLGVDVCLFCVLDSIYIACKRGGERMYV
jgi:hypothetical protein